MLVYPLDLSTNEKMKKYTEMLKSFHFNGYVSMNGMRYNMFRLEDISRRMNIPQTFLSITTYCKDDVPALESYLKTTGLSPAQA